MLDPVGAGRPRHMPLELLFLILSFIQTPAALAIFAALSRDCYHISVEKLWSLDLSLPGKPALYWAIENNKIDVVRKALAMYKHLKARKGIVNGSDEAVQWSTFSWNCGIPADQLRLTPLMLAIELGHMEIVRLLVSSGIVMDMRRRGWCEGERPAGFILGWVIHTHCHPDICHADLPEPSTSFGPVARRPVDGVNQCETALHCSIWVGRPDMLRFLLENGAEVGFRGAWQENRNYFDCTQPLAQCALAYFESKGFPQSGLEPVDQEILEVLEEFGVNTRCIFERPWRRRLWQ